MPLMCPKYIKILLLSMTIFSAFPISAQIIENSTKSVNELQKAQIDTAEVQILPPAFVTGKKKGRKWRKYYRLVHNFSKTYPYALLAKEKLSEADSTIDFNKMTKGQRKRYISKLQDELFSIFEKPLRNLTISQGRLLLKLIDRETGITSYNIVRNYKGKIAAGFWQGIAKIFGSDMKHPYDKDGEDKDIEELVIFYQRGEFRLLYFSIFGKNPPEPVMRPKNDFNQI